MIVPCPACGKPATYETYTSIREGKTYRVTQYNCVNTAKKKSRFGHIPKKEKPDDHPAVKVEELMGEETEMSCTTRDVPPGWAERLQGCKEASGLDWKGFTDGLMSYAPQKEVWASWQTLTGTIRSGKFPSRLFDIPAWLDAFAISGYRRREQVDGEWGRPAELGESREHLRPNFSRVEADCEPLRSGDQVQSEGQTVYEVPPGKEAVIQCAGFEEVRVENKPTTKKFVTGTFGDYGQGPENPAPFPDALPNLRYDLDTLLALTPQGREAFILLVRQASNVAEHKANYDCHLKKFRELESEFERLHLPA